nr:cysteine-rich receptor-like protein kinase 10 isoform X2 [Arachis hypogaea]
MSFLKLILFNYLCFFLSLITTFNLFITEASNNNNNNHSNELDYLKCDCLNNKTISPIIPTTIYRSNLQTLLTSLSSHAATAGFYNATAGGGHPNETIYGMYMCRGDVSNQTCQECVETAKQEIGSRCGNNSKEGIIWYHQCFLRYSNRSFFYTLDEWPRLEYIVHNNGSNAGNEGSYGWLLASTLNEAIEEAKSKMKKFATKHASLNSSKNVYTLVQCTPDLWREDCSKCLNDLMKDIPMCCLGTDGGMVLSPSCNLMFGLRQFYSNVTIRTTWNSLPNSRLGKYQTKLSVGNESTTLESLQFDLVTIEEATNNFSCANLIGRGGFGEVYKGILSDGREIAVKRLSITSEQGIAEFKNEVLLIAKLQHRNLVALLGFCLQEGEKILIYEFVPNKSLDYFLFGSELHRLLSWCERFKIIGGIASAILYLHEYSRLKIIHRDIKPSNILLDANMNPKISDFGMARMVAIDQDQGRTRRIVGTYGYMSPEYAMLGKYSEKSDIFSFGVMILEIVSGKKNSSSYDSYYNDGLLSHAWKQWRDGTPFEILDPNLHESCSQMEVIRCIQVGLLCVQENPNDRPQMAEVVSYLSNLSIELPFPHEPAFFVHGRMNPNMVALEVDSGHLSNSSTQHSLNEMSISISVPR